MRAFACPVCHGFAAFESDSCPTCHTALGLHRPSAALLALDGADPVRYAAPRDIAPPESYDEAPISPLRVVRDTARARLVEGTA